TRRPLRRRAGRDSARPRRAHAGSVPSAGAAPARQSAGATAGGTLGMTARSKPLYMIGVVAEMLKLHPQTLRMYEKRGLIRPSRTVGRTRMYSPEDVEEIARVTRVARDLGVNLAGIEIVLKMRRRMLDLERQVEELTNYVRSE